VAKAREVRIARVTSRSFEANATGEYARLHRSGRRGPLRSMVLALLSASAPLSTSVLLACGELPECPPGTDFDDCRVTSAPNGSPPRGTGGSPSVGAAGAGGSSTPVAAAGTSSELPAVNEGDNLDMPDPPGMDTETPPPMVDTCLNDPAKTQPGVCGCGIPDDNFDGDGAPDCIDDCPDNAGRTLPSGPCGCSTLTDTAACTGLRDALRNLYTFDGTGAQITDAVGGMNGTVLDDDGVTATAALATLQLNGRLSLDGVGSYVDLPDGLVSSLTNATFEVWLSWRGGAFWSRIFDFGSTDAGGANGETYLFLTPSNSATSVLRVAYSVAGGGAAETVVDGTAALPMTGAAAGGALEHVAVVVDAAQDQLKLYSNGVELGTVPFTGDLGALTDVNNWLGRSNYLADPPLFAALIEFRIYDQALSAAQIGTSFQAGPGALN
jgi:hypothetical protein